MQAVDENGLSMYVIVPFSFLSFFSPTQPIRNSSVLVSTLSVSDERIGVAFWRGHSRLDTEGR
jgi:hypothetical protein